MEFTVLNNCECCLSENNRDVLICPKCGQMMDIPGENVILNEIKLTRVGVSELYKLEPMIIIIFQYTFGDNVNGKCILEYKSTNMEKYSNDSEYKKAYRYFTALERFSFDWILDVLETFTPTESYQEKITKLGEICGKCYRGVAVDRNAEETDYFMSEIVNAMRM